MASQKVFINPFSGKPIQHPEATPSSGITISSFEKEMFSASNGQSIFTLAGTPITNSEIVARNGQFLNKGVGEDYTISGTAITLASDVALTIAAGEKIAVHYAI